MSEPRKSHTFRTEPCTINFPVLLKPQLNELAKKEQYSAILMMKKGSKALKHFQKELRSLLEEHLDDEDVEALVDDFEPKVDDDFENYVLKDGDAYHKKQNKKGKGDKYAYYKDHVFITVRSDADSPPDLYDGKVPLKVDVDATTIRNLFSSGNLVYGIISLIVFDKKGNRGVTSRLNGLQYYAKGTSLGGGSVDVNAYLADHDGSAAEDDGEEADL